MSKNALYIVGSDGTITQMFVSESGFNVNETESNAYTFSVQDSTVPIHAFDVSDQCKPVQSELSDCLNKTETIVTEQTLPKLFYGNVLYLLIPNVSLTKYMLDSNRNIIMTREGPVVAYILPDSQPETTPLGTEPETEISSTQTEPGTEVPSLQTESGTEIPSMQTEPGTEVPSLQTESGTEIPSMQTEPSTSIISSSVEPTSVSNEHEIVTVFNVAKSIVDSLGQTNSTFSTNTTASMTTSAPSAWSSFG
jgi:hypothetical protein